MDIVEPKGIAHLYTIHTEEDAIDFLFDHVDNLLLAEKTEALDLLITQLDLTKLNPTLLVAVLSILFEARGDLKGWGDLLQKVEGILKRIAPHKVEKLLRGF